MLAHHALQGMRRDRVQSHKRLVHEDQPRRMDPRGEDRQLLLHAVGVRRDRVRKIGGQREHLRVFRDPRVPLRLRHPENVRDEVQILLARHKIVKIRIVRDVRQLLLRRERIRPDRHAADRDLALLKRQNPHHGFQRRRLARAVVADEAVDLPRCDVQRQIVHRQLLPVPLCQMCNRQHMLFPFRGFALVFYTISIPHPLLGVNRPRVKFP